MSLMSDSCEFVSMPDEELVNCYRQGMQDAFAELSVRYLFVIRSRCRDLYGHGLEYDDLFQEGLLGLHSAVCSYQPEKGALFRTYAGVCIRHRLVSAVRRASSDRCLQDTVSLEEGAQDVPDPETEPESLLIAKEEAAELRRVVDRSLSKGEKQVLRLYLKGYSYDRIACELQVSRKYCDNAMQRVRRKLRTMT